MWEVDQYSKLINRILHKGDRRETRAGACYSLFGEAMVIDLSKGFPLLQGRKMFYKPVFGEMAAMLRGPKHVDDFRKFGCNYWDEWAASDGSMKLDYGNAWIDFNGVNQIAQLVDKLKNNPTDRRMIVSGWRPDHIAELSLPCCHMLYQWYVREGKYLDMIWYQRSVDTMVGLPSNVIQASVWNMLLANECGYIPGTVKMVLGDTHIYANHVAPTLEYLRQLNEVARVQQPQEGFLYNLDKSATVTNFRPDMLEISGYNPMPAIKFELNV